MAGAAAPAGRWTVTADERDPTRPFDRLIDLLRVMGRAEPVGPVRRWPRTTGGRTGRPFAYLLLTPAGTEAEARRAALPWVRRGRDDA
jgi:hypothetical protein